MTTPPPQLVAALADRYRLERELGQGGMATVYLAHDLRHDRRVALKVLRPELAAVIGAERFLAEIRTTANLQHPHILPLFDSGVASYPPAGAGAGAGAEPASPGHRAAEYLFYVMPFIEGESLRDRLTREKQLPVGDAVRIAAEVAGALDYAHRHAVIHRDIKPENILLHDGRALVADFGIALAANKAGGSRMTETGMSLGTPHYMSPEQAMGERELDARSDIYALGATTYELLTGEPPFTGPTAQAIVAKVMTATPEPVTTLRKTVPPHVADAVHQAIEKLPADRFTSAADFAAALEGRGTAPVGRATASRVAAPPSRHPWRLGSVIAVAVVVAFLAGRRGGGAAGPAVYDATLPDSAPMNLGATTATVSYGASLRNFSVSPAGDFLVYAARRGDSTGLWYRSLRDATVHPIAGTLGATAPRVSPDGTRVAFLIGSRVMVIPVAGGEARLLLQGESATVAEWISATDLVVADVDGYRLNWVDREATATRSKTIPRCALGAWAAGLSQLICSFNRVAELVDPESGSRRTIRTTGPDGAPGGPLIGSAFRLVGRGFLTYIAGDGSLMGVRFDPATALAGRPVALLAGVRREALGEAQYDLTADGTLVFAPGVDATVGRMVRLARGGTPEPLNVEPADFQRYDLSRNRRWLAAVVQGPAGNELRVYDLRDGQRFTWLRGDTFLHPLWSPDGERLLVSARDSSRTYLLRGSPGSGQPPDTIGRWPLGTGNPGVMDYHDAHTAVAQDVNGATVRFDPSLAAPTFDTVLTGIRFPSLSPNGRLMAQQTIDGVRVVVTTFPVPGRRWQLASAGVEPWWLSATEVLFRSGVAWYLVRVNPETGEPQGPPTLWARDPRFSDTSGWSQRPSHDGGIIYVQGPEETRARYFRVVPGWVDAMEKAAGR